ncbi:MAG: phospholipid carrier-dependent glycosyltransferase [Clostridia bacterium]|nr:phospholipid carrier-dependent glycosyltransferase [Clostridia bacterium]
MGSKFTRKDIIILTIIMLVYSVIAFVNLGDSIAPETFWENESGEQITLELDEITYIDRINIYNGRLSADEKNHTVEVLVDDEVTSTVNFALGSVFCWESIDIKAAANKLLLKTNGYIGEIVIYSEDGELIEIRSVTDYNGDSIPEIFDEQNAAVYQPSFKNGTYFDEIYHARTAYEYINGIEAYEWTHPPLGKLIISIGISIFGMNPFGWRIMGTLAGIMMLPIMYVMAKTLFKKTAYAAFACVLFSFDFMHFAQTRIATIDVYATFFIMLMYLFMYKFYEENYNVTGIKKVLKYLAFAGVCFGLGAASKWTSVYAGAGLAVIFAIYMVKRFTEYRRYNPKNYIKNTIKTLLWCVLFFVIIPIGIYILSYLPYAFIEQGGFTFENIWRIQENMFKYHSGLSATHPFSSQWYEWPLMTKPIWYHVTRLPDERIMTISAFGNPAIWWVGIPAAAVTAYYAMTDKKNKWLPFLVLIGYASQYLPWALIGRVVFIYHYFPSVPFVVLMITYAVKRLYERAKNKKNVIAGVGVYLAIVIALFVMFYPAISGVETDQSYVKNVLTWFDGWYIGG